jgi:predicted transcriptional regulator
MSELKSQRVSLGVSQIRLARLAGVSRFKISMYEVGEGELAADERTRIRVALQSESYRLRTLPVHSNFETAGGIPEVAEEVRVA